MIRERQDTFATRALARARLRRRQARGKLPARAGGPPAEANPARPAPTAVGGFFHDSLVLTFPKKEERWWLTLPVAMLAHLFALAAAIVLPLITPVERAEPPLLLAFLNPAAPPPAPPLRGTPLLSVPERDEVPKPQPKQPEPEDKTFETEKKKLQIKIPEEILKPRTELQYGIETGQLLGDARGMEGGIPGGVVGGVPGGIIGGVIGGTGTAVFPEPDVGPQAIRMTKPTYSVEGIRKKVSGDVVLEAVIDVQGKARVIRVLRSIPELDQEAIQAVERDWLFRPALKNGRPIPSLAVLTVSFNLY